MAAMDLKIRALNGLGVFQDTETVDARFMLKSVISISGVAHILALADISHLLVETSNVN
ncbi:MAG: hypothetical protein KAR12_00455 [Methylococcales bacterium]|nr:hypothetical protein [Methylococcales bacterium]